jgi:hypothetical protein
VRVVRFASPGAFLAAAEADLSSAETENNLIIGTAHDLARRTESESLRPYFAAVLEDDRVLMSAFRTQPGKVGVTRCFRSEAVQPLAEDTLTACSDPIAVIGPSETAAAFADAVATLSRKTKRKHSIATYRIRRRGG